jgi:hypothetical protein
MHAVFARAKIDRTHRKARHDAPDLIQRKPVHPRRMAIAEGADEIAFIGEADAEREC